MSEIQETDKYMRVVAIIGGIVALIESILHLVNIFQFWAYPNQFYFDLVCLVLAILTVLLGWRPIHYTPTFLGIFGLLLIIFTTFVGGIIVLIATAIGAIT
ncbi:MAG: hypothetical protein ACFFDH_22005, partial [Promethearchaeota archaeon]